MSAMDAFKIRGRANEGRQLPLPALDGSDSGHWLRVRSQWSDAFRAARDEALQQAAQWTLLSDDERRAAMEESVLAVRSTLVADWSFEEPCTPDNVRGFLKDAPQIAELVDKAGADDAAFFAGAFSSSPTG